MILDKLVERIETLKDEQHKTGQAIQHLKNELERMTAHAQMILGHFNEACYLKTVIDNLGEQHDTEGGEEQESDSEQHSD